ncbi:MAG: magnesium/cobalt efflux protein, partial [Spirochaetaceae bacterium]|nr:magnesium/cobalt efflux protein [Spirochaetaceae bacterium]
VGDIQDEFDNEREDILEIGNKVYLCDARVDIEDLNEELQLDLPDADFDTLGGFVFDLFGKIPVKFEKVRYGGTGFVVQEMDGHKIKTVKIMATPDENDTV